MRADHIHLGIHRRGADRRPGFSLVELLVVIGIISLLIGIALPAFSQAKIRVKIASTTALIENTIGTGLATFRADQQYGGSLPSSVFLPTRMLVRSPHTNSPMTAGGASFVVWALAGADLQGTPGFRDLNGSDPAVTNGLTNWVGAAPWADDMGSDSAKPDANLYAMNTSTNKPVHPRAGSYVDTSKIDFPKREGDKYVIPVDVPNQTIDSLCFLDAWEQPVLYYRAYPGNGWMVDDKPGHATNQGIYNLYDNVNITGATVGSMKGLDLGAGRKHFFGSASGTLEVGNMTGATTQGAPPRGSFGFTVWNPSVTATYRPHNQDSYILLSAGPDGLYGTPDDIGNFPTNK